MLDTKEKDIKRMLTGNDGEKREEFFIGIKRTDLETSTPCHCWNDRGYVRINQQRQTLKSIFPKTNKQSQT